MYYPLEPTKCPKCGATVKVDMSKAMLSHPPYYEWTCPNCGEKGVTEQGQIITLENQIGIVTNEGIIPDEGEKGMNNIHADKFIQQGWECPKCGAILAPNQNYCPFCSRENYSSNYRNR